MKKKFLMYGHGGCENHGCEAIIKSICDIILNKYEEADIVLSKQDSSIGIDKKSNLQINQEILQNMVKKYSIDYIISGIYYVIFKNRKYYYNRIYKDLLNWLDNNESICLSIGGDNYCYNMHNSLYFLDEKIRNKKYLNVLWGCSIEPDSLNDDDLIKDLNGFNLILARESITYNALNNKLNTNVLLCPDPAFSLEKENVTIDSQFKKNGIIGINISPTVKKNIDGKNITIENYKRMIDHIINNTNYNIMLIPHVTWDKNNDLEPLIELYNIYKNTKRIKLLPELECRLAKGFISNCDIFVGARTHSTIAAYSSCVPTLVVGYSVKAIGIAQDLFGTSENYVVDSRELNDENKLLNNFLWIEKNKDLIKNHLNSIMPEYIQNCKNSINYISNLENENG